MNSNLKPDFQQAARFLTLLDEEAEFFTFQTFDDNADRKQGSLAKIIHGSIDDPKIQKQLTDLQNKGAGVFVTVNKTDGKGRKTDNITQVRTVFQEADRGDEPEPPMEPHIVVESSSGKHHRYFLTDGGPLDEFRPVQQRLVDDYGSDPDAKDLARVLRLPGFYHQKVDSKKGLTGKPHMVRIVHESGEQPLPWEKVKQFLPPVEHKPTPPPSGGTPMLKLAEVWSALQAIDPDSKYGIWLSVLMALHHETGGSVEGLNMADEWSERGNLYREGEVEYRWGTLGKNPRKVTIKSLFKLAYESGWDGKYDTEDKTIRLAKEQYKRMIQDFNDHHGMVMVEGRALVIKREMDVNADYMVTRFINAGNMMQFMANVKVPIVDDLKGKIEEAPLFPIWQNMKSRRTYHQIGFYPHPRLIAGDRRLPSGGIYNLYQGLALAPREGDYSLILSHIRHVWCGDDMEVYGYVIGWLARLVQQPYERGHTVTVLRSGEGTGKNIIVDILVRAFGAHAAVCTRPEDLTGRFNDHLATSVLIFANEAVWGGDKSTEGVLKALITDETLPVEKKYIPKFRVRNCAHLIMALNNDWVAPIGLDDRRFFVIDVNESRKGDAEYFKQLAGNILAGGEAAFLHYLMNLPIALFDPRKMPKSKSATKMDNKIRSADSVTQWWFDVLYDGEAYARVEDENSIYPRLVRENLLADWDRKEINVPCDLLYSAYVDWANRMKRHAEHKTSFGKKLHDLCPKIRVARPWQGGDRTRVYQIPDLEQCRATLDWITGQKGPWDDNLPSCEGKSNVAPLHNP